jgi:hypothetical protein
MDTVELFCWMRRDASELHITLRGWLGRFGLQKNNKAELSGTVECAPGMAPFRTRRLKTHRLEFNVRSEGWHDHWAAVLVVAGIIYMLHARSEVDSAPDVGCVVGLDYVFASIA